ncbi:MAG: polysaccharide deacetylase family protein [Proteobacteria bacterium]|nr:polysaccharide deacetylase family protein [Pseudomonadota bacterium]
MNRICFRYLRGAALALTAAVYLFGAPLPAIAADSAVIVMYHRFGEERFPSTNIRIEQFESHIAELKRGPYTVLPVPEIIAAIRAGKSLPDRTVGITIDDGYLSIFKEAWPRLKKAGLPLTVFISTDAVNRGLSSHMNWDQIRELAENGVTIGAHTISHHHMARAADDRNRSEISDSNAQLASKLGTVPRLFAYPFGEASSKVMEMAKNAGYMAAFGQHSGVINPRSRFLYLPRFALNEQFGNLDRFKLVINTLPIPVSDLTPADPTIRDNNPPNFGFTIAEPVERLSRLRCFASHGGKTTIERLGDTRFEIRFSEKFPAGRSRINCTIRMRDGRYRWLGEQFYVRKN